jgi:peptidoglycan/xylan/chitin deacetylase (PgdA/CDA1 family)
MKAAVKRLVGRALLASRLDALLLRETAVIVAFHRILPTTDPADPLSIDVPMFERFCRSFRRHFRVISLPDLAQTLGRGGSVSRRLAITFDDGYRDNFEHAAPVLSRLSLPATFFVVTQWIGTDVVPWWDEAAGVRHPWMTWDQVRALSRRGFDIGAHTRTHADLGRVAGNEAREEILGARLELQARIGADVASFAYPYGGPAQMTDRNRALVKSAGFSSCCSGFGGVNRPDTDPFDLRRVPITPWYSSPEQFAFEIATGRSELTPQQSRDHTCCETLEATGS